MLHRSSSCMHAVAITPVESQSASFALFLCNISLPRNHGGSASTSRLSRPAQRSLALRPAYSPSHFHDPLHRRLQPFRYLHNCSDCYRLERKLPGGICTRWKTVPLHGAHDKGRYRSPGEWRITASSEVIGSWQPRRECQFPTRESSQLSFRLGRIRGLTCRILTRNASGVHGWRSYKQSKWGSRRRHLGQRRLRLLALID